MNALSRIAVEKGIPSLKPGRVWVGKTAVILGNGTSLIGMDLSVLKRDDFVTMVANSGYKTFPEADVLMCSDRHWLADNDRKLDAFLGRRIVVTRPEAVSHVDRRMRYIRRAFIEHVTGDVFRDASLLVEGHTSTSTNLSLAVLRGVKRIILLGIDLKPGEGGRRRAQEETLDDNEMARRRYAKQIHHLTMQSTFVKKRGVEVINCSPRSGLVCYPYADLESVL